ncbi:DNA polymerase III subunit delta [Hymenobacter amundsenii]|uniref:DNA polymerase III subunit delta n=1 Tax=Hymenobacter amundsenii TaxID=2006685 RepID=A0A246FIC9_9BACT|nr:DNA polymerase III subunit delta [Hymenobacter amundsenii]OWP62292.1 DNA polymerase III subunit delta [Hymenobacter amundsenii]
MTLSPDEILAQLKQRQFAPVYFLQGEEPYYIDLIAGLLEKNVLQEQEKGFNQVVLYGKDTDVAGILGQAKRFPMMAERSVVIVKEAQAVADLENDKVWPFLEAYLLRPLQSTVLVFCYKHKTLDARRKLGKLLVGDKKTPAPAGTVLLTSKKLYDNQVAGWLTAYVRSKGQQITPQATNMLAEYIGGELSRLTNEVDKMLLNLLPGHSIDEDLVQRMVGISKEYNIFELQTALIRRDVLKANRILLYFEANPKNNPLIPNLTLLFNYFSRLLALHQNPNPSEADWLKLGLRSAFQRRDYQTGLKVFDFGRCRDIVHLIRRADAQSKGIDSGSMGDGEILRELIWLILHPVPLHAVTG